MHQEAEQTRNHPLTTLQRGDGQSPQDEDAGNHISPPNRLAAISMIAETIFFMVEMRPTRTRFYRDHEQGRPRGRAGAAFGVSGGARRQGGAGLSWPAVVFRGFLLRSCRRRGRPEPERRVGRPFCGGSHGNDSDQASEVAGAAGYRGGRCGGGCCRGGGSPRACAGCARRRRRWRHQRPLSTRAGSYVGRGPGVRAGGGTPTRGSAGRRCSAAMNRPGASSSPLARSYL